MSIFPKNAPTNEAVNSPTISQPRTEPSVGLNPQAPAYAPTPPTTYFWVPTDQVVLLQTAKAVGFNPSDLQMSQSV